tara:strand:+ start:12932 stop:13213 length:282 start_codon:yes stop_codon:yes gene_type:complete
MEKRITKWFWVFFAITTSVFIFPTVATWSSPYIDGFRIYGFPAPFYVSGGFCVGECGHEFKLYALIFDLILLIGIPAVVNYLVLKHRNRFKNS